MRKLKGAAAYANTSARVEAKIRKAFPHLYADLMSTKTSKEEAITEVLENFAVAVEEVTVKEGNDYSAFVPKGRLLGDESNDEGLIAQLNNVQLLSPYAVMRGLEEIAPELLEFDITTQEKRDLELTKEESFIRDMDYYLDTKGNAVYVPTKISDSVVFFRTSTNKVAYKVIKATVKSLNAGLSPADCFLETYLEEIKAGVVTDAKGKSHRASTTTIFNSFVYTQDIGGNYSSVNWGSTVYHTPDSAIKLSQMGFFWASAENANDWKELNKTLGNRIVKSSVAQGYSILVAPTEELARQMEIPYVNCGAKFSMQGTIGFVKELKSAHKAKVIVRTITDANASGSVEEGKGINNIAGNTILVTNETGIVPSRKLHVVRKEVINGVELAEWTRLKMATQVYNNAGIKLEVNGVNADSFYVMSANEIKFKRDEETLESTPVMSDSPEIITALETFCISKEEGTFNFHGAEETVVVYTVALAEDEYNSSYYNVKSMKGSKMYESFMAMLDTDLTNYVLGKYVDFASMNNALQLSQYDYRNVEFKKEMSKGKVQLKTVESNNVTGFSIYTNTHKTVRDLEGNAGTVASNSEVVKSLMGELNICYAQVTNLVSFIDSFDLTYLFSSGEGKRSMAPKVFAKKMNGFLKTIIKEAMNLGYEMKEVVARMLELKTLIDARAFEKMGYDIIQLQAPIKFDKADKRIGGELVNVSCKIDSFQFANALEVNKKRILTYYNELNIAKKEEEIVEAAGNMSVVSKLAEELKELETRRNRNEDVMNSQWNKLRATIHKQLKKGVYSFFKGHDTLYTTLQFRTAGLGIGEVLLPEMWANKYQLGDYVLVFRHPVICSVLTLRVAGFTTDNTIQINHMLSKNIEADADGDNINVWALDMRDEWASKVPTDSSITFNTNTYRELIAGTHITPEAEVKSIEEFETDSINNYVGKMMTYELTGMVGHFIRRILMTYKLAGKTLLQREIEEIAILEQICVQGKNIGKRGLFEKDPEVQLAVKAAKNLSYKLDIEKMVREFFAKYLGKEEVVDSTLINAFDDYFGL